MILAVPVPRRHVIMPYLPDLWLPEPRQLAEVKGFLYEDGFQRLMDIANGLPGFDLVILGHLPPAFGNVVVPIIASLSGQLRAPRSSYRHPVRNPGPPNPRPRYPGRGLHSEPRRASGLPVTVPPEVGRGDH